MTIPELIEQYEAARTVVEQAHKATIEAREAYDKARKISEDASIALSMRLEGKSFVCGGKCYWNAAPYTGIMVSELVKDDA